MCDSIAEQIWSRFPDGGSSLVLMIVLGKAAGEHGKCEISMAQLAIESRMSRTSVWRVLGEFQQEGWIVADRLSGRAAIYRVQIELGKIAVASDVLPETTDQKAVITSVAIYNTPSLAGNLAEAEHSDTSIIDAKPTEEREAFTGRAFRSGHVRHARSNQQTIHTPGRRKRQPW